MGRLVEQLAPEYGSEVAGIVEITNASRLAEGRDPAWGAVDVAIDFSQPDAVPVNFPALAKLGMNVVIGTTGWTAHEPQLRSIAADAGIGWSRRQIFRPGSYSSKR
jgi:4-hydroxy-tetrahydrodipicolinate reductase